MVKVISLSEAAYKELKRMKKEGMSFSDVIINHINNTKTEKTETVKDLIHWAKNLPIKEKKEKISTNIDAIVYSVER